MNIIVTGSIGVGKTTICKKVIDIVRRKRYICGGVITLKSPDENLILQNVRTGETRILASTKDIYPGPRTSKYCFNPEAFDFGNEAIDGSISSDITIVDELGYLELQGQGFSRVIEQVTAGTFKHCILVIRSDLLSSYLSRLGVETTVFETAFDNRDRLPEKICLALRLRRIV
jgi:iron complex transport system ATP-binding protein